MRTVRTAIAGTVAAAVAFVATGCYPPSQTPTNQPIPPGGKVVATGPILTEMWIEDATDDLSTIVYGRHDFWATMEDQVPYSFWVYDEDSDSTTAVPVGRSEYGSASLAPDGRSVVFTSNDARLQVGPTAVNCEYATGPWGPYFSTMCDELYLFDLDTGQRTQLTGLDGSSEVDNWRPSFTADGQSVEFSTAARNHPSTHHRLDLATGQIEDIPAPTAPTSPTSWDRGTHEVTWNGSTGTLTSQDKATGDVTTLWSDDAVFYLSSVAANGRFIVLSHWQTGRLQVFRLIDTDTGSVRVVSTPWISEDGSRYAVVQLNVSPEAIDRLVIAPLQP